jgi:predicted DNA-binding protein
MAATLVVRVPAELNSRLRAIAEREERQIADVVRRALIRGVEVLERPPS